MTTKEERAAYARGYAAGKRRRQREVRADDRERRREAFWLRVYATVLPEAMACNGWKVGEKAVTSTEDRVDLARRWADRALSTAIERGRI